MCDFSNTFSTTCVCKKPGSKWVLPCVGFLLFLPQAWAQQDAPEKPTRGQVGQVIEEGVKTAVRATAGSIEGNQIQERIKALHKRQAEYLKNVAAGKIKPNAELTKKWPQIQKDVFAIRDLISGLNKLDADDPKRPGFESKILSSLQYVGLYLVPAEHPQFTPRKIGKVQLAEMTRIEQAIKNISYGDRKKAEPVTVAGPSPVFTLLHLPVPLVLKGQPGEKIYLSAETGGSFSNGLSLIELETDQNGVAKTTWVSIGESVGTCYLSVYSRAAVEVQEIQIEVVSPSLAVLEGLPKPDKVLLPIPKVPVKSLPLDK